MHRSLLYRLVPALVVIAGCAAPAAQPARPRAATAAVAPPYDVPAGARGEAPEAMPPARLMPAGFTPPPEHEEAIQLEDRTVYRVPVGNSPVRGKATALVTIVEFADYQCPFCTRAEETLRDLRAHYGDQIRVVWKNQPLPFHKRAEPAAELSLEARAQKGDTGFWAVHDALLGQRGHFEDDDLTEVAKDAGLDAGRALRNVGQRKYAASIDEDMDLADDIGAQGTPTFFINGRKLVGAQPFDRFVTIIDQEIESAKALVAGGVPAAKVYETIQQKGVSSQLEKVNLPAPTAANPSRGPADAKIVIQVFSDYQCPFCRRVEPTLSDLEAAFPGQIRIVWRNHPLSFHAKAGLAAEASMEAFAQKGDAGFWRMHDLLMQNQAGAGLERAAIEGYAQGLGLDMDRFRTALDEGTHKAEIAADVKVAEAAGLSGTPAFVINGYKVVGAQPLIRFKKAVTRALADMGSK
jgi:protein-disulfide isomerase